MARVTEAEVINKLAEYYREIDGMNNAFDFAENPDNITSGILPATLFFPRETTMAPEAHHNVWRNQFDVVAITIVAPRQSAGGKLKYLENRTISLMPSIRQKFQTESVINGILGIGLVKGFISSMVYGSGGQLLSPNGIEHIGIITTFDIVEKN